MFFLNKTFHCPNFFFLLCTSCDPRMSQCNGLGYKAVDATYLLSLELQQLINKGAASCVSTRQASALRGVKERCLLQ